jgi:hypothetical protein
MKLKALLSASALVAGLSVMAPTSLAANDCCWDWAPAQEGVDDQGEINPKDNPNSDWAQCTNTPAGPGGPGNPCFQRDGRQMIWVNWTCLPGPAPAPDGHPPSNPSSGYYCAPKGPGSQDDQPKGGDPPPVIGSGFAIEGTDPECIDCPTMSEWGLIVMGLLIVTGGTIVIRRAGAARPVTA